TVAYRNLISDPELRVRMGRAARRRAVAEFDWEVIGKEYGRLWSELAERRRADPESDVPVRPFRRPDRADPFTMFRTYATHTAVAAIEFQRRRGADPERAISALTLDSTARAAAVLPTPDLIRSILKFVSED